jgi:hypothetical protein
MPTQAGDDEEQVNTVPTSAGDVLEHGAAAIGIVRILKEESREERLHIYAKRPFGQRGTFCRAPVRPTAEPPSILPSVVQAMLETESSR